jgi:uncharacterized damage-inducible protein DinB
MWTSGIWIEYAPSEAAMLDKQALSRLIDYTIWANHRVMRACATVPVDDFRRELGASFGGLRGTLSHVLWAEWIWLERWKGISPTGMPDESEFETIVALRDRWKVIEDHRGAWLYALPPEDAASIIRYRNTKGVAYEAPLWQLVQHVANHSTYHRGQVVSMLRQVGARTVCTDMVVFDREAQLAAR